MTQGISELVARFESARQNLTTVLEQGEAESGADIAAADRELSTVFSQIMDAQHLGREDCALRIEFLLNEIIVASDSDGLISLLADQALQDMKQAVSEAEPARKSIPAAS